MLCNQKKNNLTFFIKMMCQKYFRKLVSKVFKIPKNYVYMELYETPQSILLCSDHSNKSTYSHFSPLMRVLCLSNAPDFFSNHSVNFSNTGRRWKKYKWKRGMIAILESWEGLGLGVMSRVSMICIVRHFRTWKKENQVHIRILY